MPACDCSKPAPCRRSRALQRGKTPIVVGGTGLYLRWFVHGKPNTPVATPASEAAAAARLEQVSASGPSLSEALNSSTARALWTCDGAGAAGADVSPWVTPRQRNCHHRRLRSNQSAAPWLQAYAEAAAARGGGELSPEERWAAGVALVAALGDGASAERLRGEFNNRYRLLRVVDILLQSGGKPLAGGAWRQAAVVCGGVGGGWRVVGGGVCCVASREASGPLRSRPPRCWHA